MIFQILEKTALAFINVIEFFYTLIANHNYIVIALCLIAIALLMEFVSKLAIKHKNK